MNTYFYLSIIFFAISILTAKYKSKHLFNAILNTSSIFVYLILTILYFSADYFTNEGLNEAVLYTVQYGLRGAGFGEYTLLLSLSVFFFVLVFALSYMYFRIINNTSYPKPKKIKGSIHNIFLILAFLFHPFVVDSYALYQAHHPDKSFDFNQYYKTTTVNETEKISDLNLVYIYAESLERTYFDEKIFPNLVDNLKQLREESFEFTDINQVPATGWTIGGMVASQCAIPLFTYSGGSSMGNASAFMSGAECFGDVLNYLGYHLVYVQGASTKFSGKDKFYRTHKFHEIYGREELIGFLKDKSYVTGWGLYDDSTLDIAFEKYEKLSQDNKKFALFTLTLDTHQPFGHPSKSCKDIPYRKGENPILNAVHCSDYLISKFIRKIQNSKYANNTLIVLTSDHLSRKNTATELLSKGERRDLFLIFDPRSKQYIPINKKGSMLDVTSTVLSKLGINTDFGLGRNLFSKDSLYASFDNFGKKLISWRDDVLAFWQFPKVTASYDINVSDKKVSIANHYYRFPVLFKIDKNKGLEPFFEDFSSKTFLMYLKEFEPTQRFIWIDICAKIDYFSDTNSSSTFCAAQGNLSGNVEIIDLKENTYNLNTDNLFMEPDINMNKYHHRLERIKTYRNWMAFRELFGDSEINLK